MNLSYLQKLAICQKSQLDIFQAVYANAGQVITIKNFTLLGKIMNQTATERRKHFDAIAAKAEQLHQENPTAYNNKL